MLHNAMPLVCSHLTLHQPSYSVTRLLQCSSHQCSNHGPRCHTAPEMVWSGAELFCTNHSYYLERDRPQQLPQCCRRCNTQFPLNCQPDLDLHLEGKILIKTPVPLQCPQAPCSPVLHQASPRCKSCLRRLQAQDRIDM